MRDLKMRFSLLTFIASALILNAFVCLFATVWKMVGAFSANAATPGGGSPQQLAAGIQDAMWLPAVGFLSLLLGIVLVVVRIAQRTKEAEAEVVDPR